MANTRPVKRLLNVYEVGEGKAEVIEKPSVLNHVLFVASNGQLGRRNVAIMMMLFGSGLRINEVAQLKVSDVYFSDGTLKRNFVIPASYTKTNKARPAYIIAKVQRSALKGWYTQRLNENALLSDDGSYGGLRGDSPLFLSKKSGWRKFSFTQKKYNTKKGIKTTMVCASLENTVRELIKSAGVIGGSSHSGRRTLATLMNRADYDLELIQRILGHSDPEMSLEYIDPWMKRIEHAYKNLWKGLKYPNFNDDIVLNNVLLE